MTECVKTRLGRPPGAWAPIGSSGVRLDCQPSLLHFLRDAMVTGYHVLQRLLRSPYPLSPASAAARRWRRKTRTVLCATHLDVFGGCVPHVTQTWRNHSSAPNTPSYELPLSPHHVAVVPSLIRCCSFVVVHSLLLIRCCPFVVTHSFRIPSSRCFRSLLRLSHAEGERANTPICMGSPPQRLIVPFVPFRFIVRLYSVPSSHTCPTRQRWRCGMMGNGISWLMVGSDMVSVAAAAHLMLNVRAAFIAVVLNHPVDQPT